MPPPWPRPRLSCSRSWFGWPWVSCPEKDSSFITQRQTRLLLMRTLYFKPRKSRNSEMLHTLPSASTDTKPLPFDGGRLWLGWRGAVWGAPLVSRNVVGTHQARGRRVTRKRGQERTLGCQPSRASRPLPATHHIPELKGSPLPAVAPHRQKHMRLDQTPRAAKEEDSRWTRS